MAGESEAVVAATELRCENCGAPWEMRGFANTRTLACESCGSIFDVRGGFWELVQKVEGAYNANPAWKLGTRGTLDGIEWEIIGWAKRAVVSYGTRYTWEEHVLFNPYYGVRYLMVQERHFVVVTPIAGQPSAGLNRANFERRTYRHFATATNATVVEVLGEFPWEVRRGDMAIATDYVDPPRILSSEKSEGEMVWSEGRYLTRQEVVEAFGEPTRPIRRPGDIHPCQPNPYSALSGWMTKALLVGVVLWALLSVFYVMNRQDKVVWRGEVADSALVEFTLDSRISPATIEIDGHAPVDNSWVYYDGMLIEKASEKASYVGMEISYYHGYSGGESWSEGSKNQSEILSGVPNGTYLLQLNRHPGSLYKGASTITVRRDVPLYRYPCCSLFLLLIVPAFAILRSRSFEHRRWQQSDHGS